MQPSWTGRIVSLDRTRDRRGPIAKQLQRGKLSAAYAWFDAPEDRAARAALSPAESLRFHAHQAALAEEAPPSRWLHVVEDGAVLASAFAGIAGQLIASDALQPFDLVFTDVVLTVPNVVLLRHLKAAYDKAMANAPDVQAGVLDLRDFKFGGSNSYFVNPDSLEKLRSLLEQAADAGRGPSIPLDAIYAREVREGRLRAACIFPYLTRVGLRRSTTPAGASEPAAAQRLANDLLRCAFCVEYDANEVAGALAPFVARTAGDRHLELVLGVLGEMIAG